MTSSAVLRSTSRGSHGTFGFCTKQDSFKCGRKAKNASTLSDPNLSKTLKLGFRRIAGYGRSGLIDLKRRFIPVKKDV